MTTFKLRKKVGKNSQTSCTSSDLDKTPAKFQKDKTTKNVTKINPRITTKRHAHLQTLTKKILDKTRAKF